MADAHSTPDSTPTGTEHNVIVRYRPNHGDRTTPSITLSGKWLRDAGFDTGQHILVKVMQGCVVLIKHAEKKNCWQPNWIKPASNFGKYKTP